MNLDACWSEICTVDVGPLVAWLREQPPSWPEVAPTKPQRVFVLPDVFAPVIAFVLVHFWDNMAGRQAEVAVHQPMLSRLLSGQSHPMHVDSQRADWITRVHVPVTTNERCWFQWEEECEQIEVRMLRGDITDEAKLPLPFKDQDKQRVGDVVGLRFDGQYTVGEVLLYKKVRFEVGKAYSFDTTRRHAFSNDGDTERVHLIFDVLRRD